MMKEMDILKYYYEQETEKINLYGKAIKNSPSARAKMMAAAERKIALGKAMEKLKS